MNFFKSIVDRVKSPFVIQEFLDRLTVLENHLLGNKQQYEQGLIEYYSIFDQSARDCLNNDVTLSVMSVKVGIWDAFLQGEMKQIAPETKQWTDQQIIDFQGVFFAHFLLHRAVIFPQIDLLVWSALLMGFSYLYMPEEGVYPRFRDLLNQRDELQTIDFKRKITQLRNQSLLDLKLPGLNKIIGSNPELNQIEKTTIESFDLHREDFLAKKNLNYIEDIVISKKE